MGSRLLGHNVNFISTCHVGYGYDLINLFFRVRLLIYFISFFFFDQRTVKVENFVIFSENITDKSSFQFQQKPAQLSRWIPVVKCTLIAMKLPDMISL